MGIKELEIVPVNGDIDLKILLYAGNSEYPTVPKNGENLLGADNQQATSFRRESSTTKSRTTLVVDDIVWPAWRHAEVDRNDQSFSVN